MDVLHAALWVSDLDESVEFYCDGVGLEFSREFTTDGVINHFLTGESDAELQLKHDPDRHVEAPTDGFDHVALGVTDVEATVEHLESTWESEIRKPPTVLEDTGSTIAFVTDPDGYVVELIEPA